MELILTGVGEFCKLWCTRKLQGARKGEGGRKPYTIWSYLLIPIIQAKLCLHFLGDIAIPSRVPTNLFKITSLDTERA